MNELKEHTDYNYNRFDNHFMRIFGKNQKPEKIPENFDNWIGFVAKNRPRLLESHYVIINEFLKTIEPRHLKNAFDGLSYYKDIIISTDNNSFDQEIVAYFDIPYTIIDEYSDVNVPEKYDNVITGIIETYGYTVGYRYFDDQIGLVGYACVKNYTRDLTEYVYEQKKFPGFLWHVCPRVIWENKISKNGIIPKFGNKHKRVYAPRSYYYTEFSPDLNFYIKDLSKACTNPLYRNADDYVVLQIDLTKTEQHYNFYNDDEYGQRAIACFTYDTIHPRCITLINN